MLLNLNIYLYSYRKTLKITVTSIHGSGTTFRSRLGENEDTENAIRINLTTESSPHDGKAVYETDAGCITMRVTSTI